jgi:hypothetical protein
MWLPSVAHRNTNEKRFLAVVVLVVIVVCLFDLFLLSVEASPSSQLLVGDSSRGTTKKRSIMGG